MSPQVRASRDLYRREATPHGGVLLRYVLCGCPVEGKGDCPHNYRLCRLPGAALYRRTPARWRKT